MIKTTFHNVSEITNFLSTKVLELRSIETKIFDKLFCNGRVVLLADGYDEISPSFQEFVNSLLKAITCETNNALLISTRAHLIQEIDENISKNLFKLKPLSRNEQKNFFQQFIRRRHFNSTQITEKTSKFESFLDYLDQTNWVCKSNLPNPLLMRMTAEILCSSDDNFSPFDIFMIYERYVDIMIDKMFDKGLDARYDIKKFATEAPNILDFHYKTAFDVIFQYETLTGQESLLDSYFSPFPKISQKQMTRTGLVSVNRDSKVYFIHRTFAEYFVAAFFYKFVFNCDLFSESNFSLISKEFIKLLMSPNERNNMILVYLNNALQSIDLSVVVRKIKLANKGLEKDYHENVCLLLAGKGCDNLVRVVSFYVDSSDLLKLWQGESLHRYNKSEENKSILMTVANRQAFHVVQSFWLLAKELFSEDELTKLLLYANHINRNILHFSAENKEFKVFCYFFKLIKDILSETDLRNFLFAEDTYSFNIIEIAAIQHNICFIESFYKFLEKEVSVAEFKNYLKCQKNLMYIVRNAYFSTCYSLNFLREHLAILKIHLSLDEIKEMFMKKTKHKYMTSTLVSKDVEKVEIIQTFLADNFCKEFSKLVLDQNSK